MVLVVLLFLVSKVPKTPLRCASHRLRVKEQKPLGSLAQMSNLACLQGLTRKKAQSSRFPSFLTGSQEINFSHRPPHRLESPCKWTYPILAYHLTRVLDSYLP